MRRPLVPPFRGVTNSSQYVATMAGFVPLDAMRNVRAWSSGDGRFGLSKRPGSRKLFTNQIGGGLPVQAIFQVSRASQVSGYTLGDCVDVTDGWESRTAGTLAGHVWIMDGRRGLDRSITTPGALPNVGAFGISVSRDGTKAAYCLTDNTASPRVSYVRVISMVDGSEVALIGPISESPADAFLNITCWGGSGATDEYLFVSINGKIRAYRTDTWAAYSTSTLNGHSYEVTGLTVPSAGGVLYASFDGNNVAGTLPNAGPGVISAGKFARHFRSGVMRFTINARAALGTALTQVSFGEQLATNATYYEQSHGYFRFSEQFAWAPNGCLTKSIAAHPDGGVIVAHTNRGWGPTAAFPPTFTPFATITRINASGGIDWQDHTDSAFVDEAGDGGYQNDIPTGTPGSVWPNYNLDYAAVQGVACGANGNVYAAGRMSLTTSDGSNVFAYNDDGVRIWEANCGRVLAENGITIDPTDDNPVVVGNRNDEWTGASSRQAHLWKLDKNTGEILNTIDLGENVGGLGVAINAEGRIVYGTAYVT